MEVGLVEGRKGLVEQRGTGGKWGSRNREGGIAPWLLGAKRP